MKKENTFIKKDTLENWAKAKNFIPKENEVIIYINIGKKVGDGITKVNDLPFIDNSNISYSVDGTTLIIKKGD